MFMLESFAKNLYCSRLYIRKYCQEIVNTIPYYILAEWLLLSDLLFKIFSALWFIFQCFIWVKRGELWKNACIEIVQLLKYLRGQCLLISQ